MAFTYNVHVNIVRITYDERKRQIDHVELRYERRISFLIVIVYHVGETRCPIGWVFAF